MFKKFFNPNCLKIKINYGKKIGLVIDIDGVILKKHDLIPTAKEAIEKLQKNKIPFLFLTNGGGVLEEKKSKQLSEILGLHINKNQSKKIK
jgi:ribonucleotide monophosphatase NagD (HAD superfamily)